MRLVGQVSVVDAVLVVLARVEGQGGLDLLDRDVVLRRQLKNLMKKWRIIFRVMLAMPPEYISK
jgi:hypothetical protein